MAACISLTCVELLKALSEGDVEICICVTSQKKNRSYIALCQSSSDKFDNLFNFVYCAFLI